MISLIQTAKDLLSFIGRSNNPHAVTASQVGAYSSTEIDNLVSGVIMPTSDIPLTRFGSLLWLPLNFAGSFEGATRNEINYFAVCHFENDGTPVALINATNGVRESVYYSSFKLDANGAIVDHIPAATEYRPAFLQVDWWCSAVMPSAARGAAWGYLSGNPDYNAWVCLTNNTLNWASHQGAVCNVPSEITDQCGWVCASGEYVYLFHAPSPTLDINVWRIAAVDIRTKAAVTWEKVTGIKTQGVRNLYTADYIKLGGTTYSANESDDPVFVRQDNVATPSGILQIYGDVDPTTGEIGICAIRAGSFGFNFNNYGYGAAIYFTFNPTARTATVPTNLRGTTTLRPSTVAPGYEFVGPNVADMGQIMIGVDQQPHKSLAVSNDNFVLVVQYSNENAGGVRTYRNTDTQNPVLPAAFWNYSKRTVKQASSKSLIRQYPSPLGDSARNTFWLSPTKVGLVSYGNGNDIFSRKTTVPVSDLSGGPTFTFNTARLGVVKGFRPSPRDDVGNKYQLGHAEYWTSEGALRVGMSRLYTGRLSSATDVSSDLDYTGSVSITQAQHDAIVNAVIAAGPDNYPRANAATVRLDILIVAESGKSSQGVLVTHDPAVNIAYEYFFTLNVSGFTGAIANISLKKLWWNRANGSINAITVRNRESLPPACIMRNAGEGFTVISWNTIYAKNSGGSQPGVVVTTMQLDGADDIRSDFIKIETSNPWYFGFVHRGFVPGLGFGSYDMSANRLLSGTGTVFRKLGNTKALIDAWTLDADRWMVLTQQAPIGWYVYAAEAVPCLMNGSYRVIPTASIDLSKVKANPENSTFYIYVQESNGTFTYVAKTAPVAETISLCFIGTVITNATQITKLTVEKVTRLGVYRLSATQIGSAIPTVPGNAATTATLDWTMS